MILQKKKDNFLEKIVKKDYNNELEQILEKKYFEENVKSTLLSILYKIEAGYKDYEKAKQNVPSKEEFIQNIINIIKNDCDDIKLIKPNSPDVSILGKKTFIVEKNKKRIICYPIERKLLYCLAKISKNEKIVKKDYFLIEKTLSDLINVGNSINTVEPIRDFNGYSWTTIPLEIESIEHNLIYQNLNIIMGHTFMENWIKNRQFIIDYIDILKNKLEEIYGKNIEEKIINKLFKLSVLLSMKFDKKMKDEIIGKKQEIENELKIIENKEEFVNKITQEKKELTKQIKQIDETLNNKQLLQNEYLRRNEDLPLEKKIFSIRILSKMMETQRDKKIKKIEELNELIKPQKFVEYKEKLKQRYEYVKLADTENLEKDITTNICDFQKLFLKCFEIKIANAQTKSEIIKLLYEYRYYNVLPYNIEKNIYQEKSLQKDINRVGKKLIEKSNKLKVINLFSKNVDLNYEIIKSIFSIRILNIEELYLKLIKENDEILVQIFDENIFEQNVKLEFQNVVNKKDLEIKFNKKVKIFN